MRAIDGDALLKRVQQEEIQAQVHGREFSTCFISPGGTPSTEWWYVEDLIENAPTIEPERKWIPVEERLPKQNEMVLITIIRKDERYNKIPFISIGYISWNNTVWWCAHDGDCKLANVEVLAWMPLPEPYRAERRTDEGSD